MKPIKGGAAKRYVSYFCDFLQIHFLNKLSTIPSGVEESLIAKGIE
jgi:hypothetical protein